MPSIRLITPVAALALMGCDSVATFPSEPATEAPETGARGTFLEGVDRVDAGRARAFTDPETGCEYIMVAQRGITPRMELFMGSYIHRGCKDRVTIGQ